MRQRALKGDMREAYAKLAFWYPLRVERKALCERRKKQRRKYEYPLDSRFHGRKAIEEMVDYAGQETHKRPTLTGEHASDW